jgi:hypothetical protein
MTNISLNELPSRSPWPARLLGLADWSPAVRTIEKVESEYERDKYAKCLTFYDESERGKTTPEEVKRFEFGGVDREVCVSIGDKLEVVPLSEARRRHYSLIVDAMRPMLGRVPCAVELGCGYGFNRWMLSSLFPQHTLVGGEYSGNALELAGKLYASEPRISVNSFDFYAAHYDFLDACLSENPAIVFTVHALEQLRRFRMCLTC